jgi:hypothetical protein
LIVVPFPTFPGLQFYPTRRRYVTWRANYAVLGPYDYLDIFETPDIEAAMKVSTIVRLRR